MAKKSRKEFKDAVLASRAASHDSAISDPPATDANPKHREDFNSLLNAAVKKPVREG
jgi:hypothetical protein